MPTRDAKTNESYLTVLEKHSIRKKTTASNEEATENSMDDSSALGREKHFGILDIYDGQKNLESIRQGKGSYQYSNHFYHYKGEWENGKKHGKGLFSMSDGNYYEGEFLEGEITGFGKKFWKTTNAMYEGNFVNGLLSGEGKMKYCDGSTYVGMFLQNKRHGFGILQDNKGTYKGEFYENRKNGQGLQLYKQGHSYEGHWLNNHPHGYGTFSHSSGVMFSCDFESGIPKGLPDSIEIISSTEKVSVKQGSPIAISAVYVTNGKETNCIKGLRCKVSSWYKFRPPPKRKDPSIPMPDVGEIEHIESPFYEITQFPLTTYDYYISYANIPQELLDIKLDKCKDRLVITAVQFLNNSINLKRNSVSFRRRNNELFEALMESDTFSQTGSNKTEEEEDSQLETISMLHEYAGKIYDGLEWPLPEPQEKALPPCTGKVTFTGLILPAAQFHGYSQFIMDDYIEAMKSKSERPRDKQIHYFGERPANLELDSLGRPIIPAATIDTPSNELTPGESVDSEEVLKRIIIRNYAKPGEYLIKVEDTTAPALYKWFNLSKPDPGYIRVSVKRQRRKKSGHGKNN